MMKTKTEAEFRRMLKRDAIIFILINAVFGIAGGVTLYLGIKYGF